MYEKDHQAGNSHSESHYLVNVTLWGPDGRGGLTQDMRKLREGQDELLKVVQMVKWVALGVVLSLGVFSKEEVGGLIAALIKGTLL